MPQRCVLAFIHIVLFTIALIGLYAFHNWPRGEKIAHKDIKMRTFISQESGRNQLVSHVYDVSYGVVGPEDNLVALDDSIVRGTTLQQSILKILACCVVDRPLKQQKS